MTWFTLSSLVDSDDSKLIRFARKEHLQRACTVLRSDYVEELPVVFVVNGGLDDVALNRMTAVMKRRRPLQVHLTG